MKIPSLFQLSILMMVILGALLRLFGYPNIPPELNRDEAALGYNAYAILTEGVDEWGVAYPVIFRSFGDMKLPGYIYSLVPFVAGFGLENWVVRLPSLLAGIGLIWLVTRFALLLGLTKKASLFAGLIVSVSPWALHYGTTAFEANLALAFFLFFLIFLLSPSRGQKRTIIGGLFLLLSLLTYNAPLVLTPFILVFAVLSRTTTLRKGIFFGLIAVCAVLITAPASQGKANIGLWTDPGLVERVNQLRMQEQGSLIGRLIHRPFVAVIPQILQNHVQAYSWNFLVNGVMLNPWHVIGRLGFVTPEVYGLAAGGVVVCVVGIIRRGVHKKRISRGALWIVFLMVIAPLPASLTRDAPHATRSLLLFIAFALAAGWGVDQVLRVGQKISARFVSVLFLCLVSGLCVRGISVAQARVNLPAGSFNTEWWVDSRRVFSESETLRDSVGVVGDLHYAYIYPLFFEKVRPSDLRATIIRGPSDSNGHTDVLQLGKYVFFSSSRDIPSEVRYYIEQTGPGQFELKKK